MSSSLIGGLLVPNSSPAGALHGAALIAGIAPLMIVFGTWFLVHGSGGSTFPNSSSRHAACSQSFAYPLALDRRAVSLFLYSFSPAFHTPLYYHMTDNLHFSQGYISMLGAIYVGRVDLRRAGLSALPCRAHIETPALQLSIVLGTATTASFVLLFNEATAAVLNFCAGVSAMIALVASLTLAADYCPKRSKAVRSQR